MIFILLALVAAGLVAWVVETASDDEDGSWKGDER